MIGDSGLLIGAANQQSPILNQQRIKDERSRNQQ
jgi:hypothetical protein